MVPARVTAGLLVLGLATWLPTIPGFSIDLPDIGAPPQFPDFPGFDTSDFEAQAPALPDIPRVGVPDIQAIQRDIDRARDQINDNLDRAGGLLEGHGCQTPEDCARQFGLSGLEGSTDCTELLEAVERRSGIDIDQEAVRAATLACEDRAGSGGNGVMKRPVWEALLFFLSAVLVKKFLV